MSDFLASLPDEARARLVKRSFPEWVEPMLATLSDRRSFPDHDWLLESKLDGVRCLAFRNGDSIRLLSRNQKSQNNTYPEIVDALKEQPSQSFIIDGEIVAFTNGVSSFQQLQQRLGIRSRQEALNSGIKVYYYLFDIIYLDDYDVSRLNLRQRKALLKESMIFRDPICYSEHEDQDAEAYYQQACAQGLEGLIAKRAASRYVYGRSDAWLKLKCIRRQEFVIGGFTDPKGTRIGLGALLVGYYEDGKLRYAGKVGTGFNSKLLKALTEQLKNIERKNSPFSRVGRIKDAHWVEPRFVAEIGFSEWTEDGKLRHPRFEGLREDKDPEEVIREKPQ